MSANSISARSPLQGGHPFDLEDDQAYQRWREWKLGALPGSLDELRVEIDDPASLTEAERRAIVALCRRTNLAIYRVRRGIERPQTTLRQLGARFGLRTLDVNPYADDEGVSAIQALESGKGAEYIPYTTRRLGWHTDGYYNDLGHLIRGMVLYCQRTAKEGGESLLLDHDLVYIQLRDRDPDLVAALMENDAMSIPGNDFDEAVSRGRSGGPVFSTDPVTGALHMRYTARTRSIQWKEGKRHRAALEALQELISDEADYVWRYRLEPGEGLICNNVLHRRTGFVDPPEGPGRLVYRMRFFERIADT
ncbi:MAG: TauD/TfdA family dioxygenase [Gammaproteobacteria bacterium]